MNSKDSFVAIDFETAKLHHICAVGIVTVVDGEVVDEYYTLVQPPENEYSYFTIQVHGITPQQTLNAPTFYHIYPEIQKRLQDQVVVAHNEGFDRRVLSKTMRDNSMDYEDLKLADKWECTMKIYKAKGYKPYKLNACCERHGIELQHHEALSDARGCAQLYLLR
ncbi:MAG: 3'-5' exonuclease [Bacteroidales bacterium]|nr:3'-5' exonuclease [Bacteroidales bacterium]